MALAKAGSVASASLSILVTQSTGSQEPRLLETVTRSLSLLWSSWGWSWALILSWALLPHKYFQRRGQAAQRLLSLGLLLSGHHGNKCTFCKQGSFTT